jgi:hypothetical protein
MATLMLDSPTIIKKVDELREILPEFDFKKASGYKLSDAIREGSSVTKQHVGGWVGPQSTICALSAAVVACRARRML